MKNVHLLHSEDRPAPGDLRFVQGLLNTLDIDKARDGLGDAAQASAWLERFGFIADDEVIDADDAARLRSFREAIRSMLLLREDEAAATPVTAALDDLTSHVRLGVAFTADGSVALENRSAGIDGAIGRLLIAIHEAAAADHWQRLKICARDSCQWAFYDGSRNRSSNWCSMQVCGNREKAARHRHKTTAAG